MKQLKKQMKKRKKPREMLIYKTNGFHLQILFSQANSICCFIQAMTFCLYSVLIFLYNLAIF